MESKAYYIKNLLKTLGIGLIGLIFSPFVSKLDRVHINLD